MKTQPIGESIIQGFALVLECSRCDNKGEGIFAWAPSLREWLKDPDYVFWLGAGGLRIGIWYLYRAEISNYKHWKNPNEFINF